MKKITLLLAVFGMTTLLTPVLAQKQFKALLFTKTSGWHHESILDGVLAVRQLAERNNFDLVWEENAGRCFTEDFLSSFQVVIFLSTTGDILNDAQQKVFENFIKSGKGYVGIHAAADTEYDWEWYTKLVGRMFVIHPAVQTAHLKVVSRDFPGLEKFADEQEWTDEWYQFGPEKTTGLKYILSVDESTYNAKVQWGDNKQEGMGSFHPIAWYHNFDGGRAFYTALGHMPRVFQEDAFLQHLYAGILWAATGKK